MKRPPSTPSTDAALDAVAAHRIRIGEALDAAQDAVADGRADLVVDQLRAVDMTVDELRGALGLDWPPAVTND